MLELQHNHMIQNSLELRHSDVSVQHSPDVSVERLRVELLHRGRHLGGGLGRQQGGRGSSGTGPGRGGVTVRLDGIPLCNKGV